MILEIKIYDFESIKVERFDLPSIVDENGTLISNDTGKNELYFVKTIFII